MILNKLYAALGLIAVIGLAWWRYDFVVKDRDHQEARATKAESDLKSRIDNEKKDIQVLEVYHDAEEKIVYVDKIVTKEVIRYRDANPVRCTLPPDFARVYNKSITIPTDTAIGADDKVKTP